MSLKKWWDNYNGFCTQDVLNEMDKVEIIRLNNTFLYSILNVLIFASLEIYFGLYPLLINKIILGLTNIVFIYLSSTKSYKYVSHYMISGTSMASIFFNDNYTGEKGYFYLYYYLPLVEFALTFHSKKISIVLVNCTTTLILLFVSMYYDHSLFLNPNLPSVYVAIQGWTSPLVVLFAILFLILNSISTRKKFEQFLTFEKNKVDQEKLLLEMQNQDAEYRLLKTQLNPHFVFNTLETIKYLSKNDIEKLDSFIEHLSDFLRVSLKNEKGVATIEEEIIMLNDYMNLQMVRYSDSIIFNCNIDNQSKKYCIPYFSLVTMAENAIKHNSCTAALPLSIELYNDDEYIYVVNNIQKKNITAPSTGLGLENLGERYRILHQSKLIIIEEKDFFKVKLKMIKE